LTESARPATVVTEQERRAAPQESGGVATTLRPYVAAVRAEAVREFEERLAGLTLAPVVVVIAAYDEDQAIGYVLDGIASEACGLRVETIVVDDGSGDRTTEVAEAHGARVATLRRNCGHGVALRLGYELASRHGAQFIVTLDADGEWDPADIPTVLQPLVDDEADFVIGSRVLGSDEGDDLLRRAGVRLFAALVRLLTGVRVTDTSSAVRALRPEVTQTVRQEQVQYQTSELLIGAICQGYRVTERPVSHHPRLAGESKKGTNLLYGFRYARVIVRTWLRERRSRRPSGNGLRS
jgi:glycosyltransferase involved in cell wall biosynthesis